jgi:PAS domain S-box-containing protein
MHPLLPAFEIKVDQLLHEYIVNPNNPSLEEVRHLVREIEIHQVELERQNEELRATRLRLEAYKNRYVDLYDFAPLGYVTFDGDGYVQEINLAGAKMLGVEPHALIGYSFDEHVVKDDQHAFLKHIAECVQNRCEVTSELRLTTVGGRVVAVQAHSLPIEGPQDDTLCKTALTDITERRSAEIALEREHHLLRTLIDHLPDCIYVKDTESRFIAANMATAQIMGAATPSDLLGKTDSDFYPQHLAAAYRADEERILQSGRPLVDKRELHSGLDGNSRTVLTTKIPLKDSLGRVFGLVGISRDVTFCGKRCEPDVARPTS